MKPLNPDEERNVTMCGFEGICFKKRIKNA